jgi:hypothetical protein
MVWREPFGKRTSTPRQLVTDVASAAADDAFRSESSISTLAAFFNLAT